MKQLALILATGLFFLGCSTIKVDTDYDPKFAFASLARYAIIYKPKEGSDTLTDDRIMHAINAAMAEKGYSSSEKADADFYVLFHTDVTSKTKIVTDYQQVGLYPYGYGYIGYGGMVIPTTHAYTYDEAKLIVDFIDPKENKIIWRGIATDRLKSLDTPEKRSRYIDEVITKLLKSFPKRGGSR
jgi:hypothetical protein